MTERRFIYTIRRGTMVIIDKKDNVLIRDKYRACDYLNRLNRRYDLPQRLMPVMTLTSLLFCLRISC